MKKTTSKPLSKKSIDDVKKCLPKAAKKLSRTPTDSGREKLVAMSSEDFDEMMCKKFPQIFIERNKPMSETCMCWGFDVGRGWYPLLLDLCEKIDFVCKSGGGVIHVVVGQVKSKYASLRFYWHTSPVDPDKKFSPEEEAIANKVYGVIDDLVNHAVDVSSRTCEECGDRGELLVLHSWHFTLCKKHAEEHQQKAASDAKRWEIKDDKLKDQ